MGYPVGLVVAPIQPVADWRESYASLLQQANSALAGIEGLDLTVECITHRFTPGSRETLLGWYRRTKLEMDESQRSQKRTKFGSTKFVYPRETMRELRTGIEALLAEHLPSARTLYWT